MDIFLYDYSCNELGYTDKVISINRETKFNGVGTAEYHFDINNPILKVLLEHKYIFIRQSEGGYDFSDVVTGITAGEDIAVFCRSLSWFLGKMLTAPIEGTTTKSAGEILSEMLEKKSGPDVETGIIATDYGEPFYFHRSGYGVLADRVCECLSNINAGHEVLLDYINNKLIFNMLLPEETDIYISVNDGSASRIEISRDILDYCNAGFYEKEKEEDGTLQWTEITSGESDLRKHWYTVLGGSSAAEAQDELQKKTENSKTKATVQRLEYLAGYHLGDIVFVQFENEKDVITVRQQISAVKLTWDENGFSQTPILTDLNKFNPGKPPEEEEIE